MSTRVDTKFDVYSDTPVGKDPDSFSPTLRRYHQTLWSKPLPSGAILELSVDTSRTYLHHSSVLGELFLSSDSVGHTYKFVKAMSPIVSRIPASEIDNFYSICSTVGGYIIFPSNRIDGKPTINGARGLHYKIKDRFDLTLECIRRHYGDQKSPLGDALKRYSDFFDLFESFSGYVEFFLLQDLVLNGGEAIDFFVPFDGFERDPLPSTIDEYRTYKDRLTAFVTARNHRIEIFGSSEE